MDPQEPASQAAPRRELTLRVIVIGLLLSVVMGAANVYVGLKVGMTVSASIPAAVMAMLIFRMFTKGSNILEANQVQTTASAGESLAAGIIFTMPALILIGYWDSFDWLTVTAIAFTGGLLGILFMIPMRKVFVVGRKDLAYPEGVACAAVLEAGDEGAEAAGAKALVMGGVLGALFKLVEGGFHGVLLSTVELGRRIGDRVFYYGTDTSPMLIAVGLIVRLNVAVLIFIGGAIGWLVVMPFLDPSGTTAMDHDAAWWLWSNKVRYVGVGAMVLGGAMTLFQVRSGLVAAVRELRKGSGQEGSSGTVDPREQDLPTNVIAVLVTISIALVAALYYRFTGDALITGISTVVMVIMAFFMTAVASYIVGLVGNSNSPVSGMTITAVMFTGGMLWLLGLNEGMTAMVAILGVAAIVCCVACTAGDVCNDLKTGSLVGASPRRQQTMQIAGVAVAALVMAPVLNLLHKGAADTGGIGGRELPAAQASLFASLVEGFTGTRDLPWFLIGVGVAIGAVLLIGDKFLEARKSSFRLHLMPIAVGMYLPFGIATPILVGGILSYFVTRGAKSAAHAERRVHRGMLFASGVIAGEALVGLAMAGLAVKGLTPFIEGELIPHGTAQILSLVAFLAVAFFFHRVAQAGAREADASDS